MEHELLVSPHLEAVDLLGDPIVINLLVEESEGLSRHATC
jgi:hypothetical protein